MNGQILRGTICLAVLLLGSLGLAAQEPCTVTVRPGESIQAAIDAAPDGAVICLGAGEWVENVVIAKNLSLRGAGSDQTTLRKPSTTLPVVSINADEAVQLAVSVSGLAITGGTWWDDPGLDITGAVMAMVKDCRLYDNALAMRTRNGAQVSTLACTFSRNSYAVDIDGSWATVQSCSILNSHIHGVWIGEDGHATLIGNTIVGNVSSGVTCYGELIGSDNAMWSNGVDLQGNTPGSVRRVLAEASEEEILYPDPRFPSLQHAVDALMPGGRLLLSPGTHTAGITVAKELTISASQGGESRPILVAPKLAATGSPVATAISLVRDADIALEGIIIAESYYGVLAMANSRVETKNCLFVRNSNGASVGGTASAAFSDCFFIDSTFVGIEARGSSRLIAERCTVTADHSIVPRFGHGIRVLFAAEATINHNVITDNRIGIAIGLNCHDERWSFDGLILGRGNVVSENTEADLCPNDLTFLQTEEGGEADHRH